MTTSNQWLGGPGIPYFLCTFPRFVQIGLGPGIVPCRNSPVAETCPPKPGRRLGRVQSGASQQGAVEKG